MSVAEIRQELKSWENTFKEIYGRKPSKQDVDLAPGTIKTQYRRYSELRNAARSSVEVTQPSKSSGSHLETEKLSFNKTAAKSKPISSDSAADQIVTESLAGVVPNFIHNQQENEHESVNDGQHSFVSYFCAATPQEIATKRQNLCSLASLEDEGNQAEIESDTDADCEDDEDEMEITNNSDVPEQDDQVEMATSSKAGEHVATKKRGQRKRTQTTNFVRLDMKHRRYRSKANKKLKGAALKRFLWKKRHCP